MFFERQSLLLTAGNPPAVAASRTGCHKIAGYKQASQHPPVRSQPALKAATYSRQRAYIIDGTGYHPFHKAYYYCFLYTFLTISNARRDHLS